MRRIMSDLSFKGIRKAYQSAVIPDAAIAAMVRDPISWRRSQLRHAIQQDLHDFDRLFDEVLFQVHHALVFRFVAAVVAKRENSPLRGSETGRMLEALEYEVTVLRPVPMPTQCRRGQGVRRAVHETEATLDRELRIP